jgi:acetyl esterase/lipase
MQPMRQRAGDATEQLRARIRTAGTLVLLGLVVGCAAQRVHDASAAISIERDVIYVRRGEQDLRADLYSPVGNGPFPGVLLVHGGSWQRGSKGRMTAIGERLARRGYVAVSIDYRHAPEHHFPAQLHDCRAAVRWMRANASWLRIDPRRIAGFGYSAGAHLVGLLATTDGHEGLDEGSGVSDPDARLQAAVLGAAPIDLRRFPIQWTFTRFLGATADDRPDLYALASPISFVSPDDPPMFLYHGGSDWMVDASQSRLMVEALRHARVPADYYESNSGHFTTFLFDDEPVSHAIDFLDRWL